MTKLIVKDNDFIEASLNLDVVEQRIIFLAIIKARQNSDNVEETLAKEFVIHASEYIDAFEVERHTAYESLKNGVQGLLDAKFLYRYENKNNNLAERGYNLASWVEYVDNEACVTIKFSADVVPLIVGLNKKFTSYELQQIVHLQSRYAIRLYELLIRWRDTRKLNITLNDLRFCLGIKKNEYQLMSNFKNRVLDLAIEQINKYTDITVVYKQVKNGRKITGFEFNYTIKSKNKYKDSITFLENNKPKRGRPKKTIVEDSSTVHLTDSEYAIIKAKADEHILRKNISDEEHIANIHKLAIRERWGLDKLDEDKAQRKGQNEEVDSKIKVDFENRKKSQLLKQELDQSKSDFIQQFENLTNAEKALILDAVQLKVQHIPKIGKIFESLRIQGIAHKDIMYMAYFKEAMK